jgi:hypothetical protein
VLPLLSWLRIIAGTVHLQSRTPALPAPPKAVAARSLTEDGRPAHSPPRRQWRNANGLLNYCEIDSRNFPMLTTDEDILAKAEDWRKAGKGVAIATVVDTWGSAPRPVGSHLVIDEDGNFLGSVSGGCVEGEVVTEALDVIEAGKPKMLEFGVSPMAASGSCVPPKSSATRLPTRSTSGCAWARAARSNPRAGAIS